MPKFKANGNIFFMTEWSTAQDGINLLTNGTEACPFQTVNASAVTTTDETFRGMKIVHISKTDTNMFSPISETLTFVKPSTNYVYSFYAKAGSAHTADNKFYFYGSRGVCAKVENSEGVTSTSNDGFTRLTFNNEWKRYFMVFTTLASVPASVSLLGYRAEKKNASDSSFTVDLDMCGFKLEEGSFPTPI